MNDVKKQYFREIKRLLTCNAKEKQRCIMELERDVDDFIEYCPSATFEVLCAAIGSPHEVAKSFLESTDPEQLSRSLSAKRKIVIGVVAVVAMLAIALSIMAFMFTDDLHDFSRGYFVEDMELFDTPPSNAEPLPSPITEY